MLSKTNLADDFECVWFKTVIRSSLMCVCFNQWLHVGNSYQPKTKLFVIKPSSVVTESNNPYIVRNDWIGKNNSDNNNYGIPVKIFVIHKYSNWISG